MRPQVLLLPSLLLVLQLAAPARAEVYPTDQCVAEKLRAAGLFCAQAVKGVGSARSLQHARMKLEMAWADAEADSLAAGVSCQETTATAAEVAALIEDGAEEIADLAEGSCSRRRALAAGNACRTLLAAEGNHLLDRSSDRERTLLARRQSQASRLLDRLWDAGHCDGTSSSDAADAVAGLAEEAILATTVSPQVSSEWTMVTPPTQVDYQGRTLEPLCSHGTPWVFFVKRGTVNKLLMYYQGGGACWNYLTCAALPVFDPSVGPNDNPANASSGFADLDNPDNPFKDWNAVFVPYCTGDVHWGDADVTHSSPNGALSTLIHHRGYVNAQVAEKWAREHFVNPDQVFVTGSSAGSYGAIVNSLPLKEMAYPSSRFVVLGDAGNGVITRDFLENDLAKWGIEKNLPPWIPGLNLPLTELSAADLWTEAAHTYPNDRFANYTTSYDGGTGGQIGFYNIMLSGSDLNKWVTWWPPSCEWNETMRGLVQETASNADNYRYYIGTGSRHTMWGHPKVYTDTTGGVPTIVSWIRAMLDGTPDWVNVECTDCGHLLPGDPRPDVNVVQPEDMVPYVVDDVSGLVEEIVCQP
jgi:hypothetical protein